MLWFSSWQILTQQLIILTIFHPSFQSIPTYPKFQSFIDCSIDVVIYFNIFDESITLYQANLKRRYLLKYSRLIRYSFLKIDHSRNVALRVHRPTGLRADIIVMLELITILGILSWDNLIWYWFSSTEKF